ncbi:hypothetical protein [Methylocystis bryophila]|uniref:Uncharacterized protein n=1 Tax=Methylocystis bryophila TaxID=655015 RepID=A0A1W6MUA6_9HYPH|nr:hypothetical protein [Methylocystis bryophila]ARN81190.1 hypothetical protein B1812_08955 [Methylocystis bryophila]BDV37128.1 hypothetical protein DSM21852_03810 [Methylocystis bryophila]
MKGLERAMGVADAVLFEGYILYPYRPTAIKNQQRWTFGGLFPENVAGEPSRAETEILLEGGESAAVDIFVRFLHTQRRQVFGSEGEPTPSLDIDGKLHLTWDEAVLRETTLGNLPLRELIRAPCKESFRFPAQQTTQELHVESGKTIGAVTRSCETLNCALEARAEALPEGLYRLCVSLRNTTPLAEAYSRADALRAALLSTHLVLVARGAEFVSLLEPPEELADVAAACKQSGLWPVLAGAPGERDIILASPIILYDHPKIAPESRGQFFDSTEIDEMLALRVLTLTAEEKREMAATDSRTREILQRCEALTREAFDDMHGAFRPPEAARDAIRLEIGARVLLNPTKRSDIFDIALKGRIGVVQAIETDFEDRVHVAVTLPEDPGNELGLRGFPGHRFFFSLEEVTLLEPGGAP